MLRPDFYSAIGLGGQYIAVSPAHDLVVVALTSGRAGDNPFGYVPTLLNVDVAQAITSDQPLPDNPEAVAALDAHLAAIANPAPQAIEPAPEGMLALSGVPYALTEPLQLWSEPAYMAEERFGAPMDFDHFTLTFDTADTALLDLVFSDGYTAHLTVGMDGVARVNDTRFGPLAVDGSWLPGNQVGLNVDLDFVGQGDDQTLTFRMRDDGLRVMWADPAFGGIAAARAQPAPAS